MKVASVSCARIQDLALQPAWDDIRECQPDVLLLLGDTVYLDRNDNPRMPAEALRSLYERQFAQPQFAALLDDLRGRQVSKYE